MDFPLEIHKHIWNNVRQLIYKDRYNRVIRELKHFVEDQRRDKYYISKRDPDNQSMFMYLNCTLRRSCAGEYSKVRHFVYTWFIWEPYLDRWTDEPIRKPTLKLVLHIISNKYELLNL
mgnify:CR=1 FL=1